MKSNSFGALAAPKPQAGLFGWLDSGLKKSIALEKVSSYRGPDFETVKLWRANFFNPSLFVGKLD